MAHFIYRWFGVGNNGTPNTAYSFWSGVAGELNYLVIFVLLYRHFQCAWPLCHRPGIRMFGNHRLCKKHHPEGPLTKDQIVGTLEKVDDIPVVDDTEES